MPHLRDLRGEHPHTYFVQDRSNQEEMKRLEIQDRMLTTGMGGVLPELDNPASLRHVLDVGCGTGGWLMETARTYQEIETLVGVDIGGKMVEYAHAQAEKRHLGDRVQFRIMDALRMLEFPPATFDLVNQRLASSLLRTWDWRDLLLEYLRVTRAGGIIRITECDIFESNSPALMKLSDIMLEAFYRAGHFFTASKDGLTSNLECLMTKHAIEDVQTHVHSLVFPAGTVEGQQFYEDTLHTFRVSLPFFQKFTNVPSDYQEIYQQALKEMQQPDFVATWTLLTAWGIRPRDGQPIFRRGLL